VRALRAAAVCALAPLLPQAARACAVCTSGREDDTQRAFLLGTILLSTLPLALIGGIALWLRRRARMHERPPAGGGRALSAPAERRAG
jgi:hypothetical protein